MTLAAFGWKAGIMTLAAVFLVGCQSLFQPQTPQEQTQRQLEDFAQAVRQGKTMSCEIVREVTPEMAEVTGEEPGVQQFTYLIGGDKMRISGVPTGPMGEVGHMLNDGEQVYIWEEGAGEGFMMPLTQPADDDLDEPLGEDVSLDFPDLTDEETEAELLEEGYTFDCQEVNVGDEAFAPPADVVFQDFGAMIEAEMERVMQEANQGQ